MKKLISASLFLAVSVVSAHADEVVYISDGAELSSVCIAALESMNAAYRKAVEIGLSKYDLQDLTCNKVPVARFSRQALALPPLSVPMIAVRTTDASPVTALCAAAITSAEKYLTLKETHFYGISNLEDSVQCNGMPLRAFMLKYNGRNLTASI
jgi:hypothetical protein